MRGDLIKILLYSIAVFIFGLITIYLAMEHYIKYVLFSLIMSGTTIITCVGCLRKLRKEENTNENNR